ncbi:hypothetical protein D1007_33865 [Hordeum vulgare]|nr:hypothetical protein D1007_33865 [Hordeum vulgare]
MVPPLSRFFSAVLDHYGIQSLHLQPNSILLVSVFAFYCEAFVSVQPLVALFRHFFSLHLHDGAHLSVCVSFVAAQRGNVLQKAGEMVENFRLRWVLMCLKDANSRLEEPNGLSEKISAWSSAKLSDPRVVPVLERFSRDINAKRLTGGMIVKEFLAQRLAHLHAHSRPGLLPAEGSGPVEVSSSDTFGEGGSEKTVDDRSVSVPLPSQSVLLRELEDDGATNDTSAGTPLRLTRASRGLVPNLRVTRSACVHASRKLGDEPSPAHPASVGGRAKAPSSPPSMGPPISSAVAGAQKRKRWRDVKEDVVSLGAKRMKMVTKPKAALDASPSLVNTSLSTGGLEEARGAASLVSVAKPPEPSKHPKATVGMPLPGEQARKDPQALEVLTPTTVGQSLGSLVLFGATPPVAPPTPVLEAPHEGVQKASVLPRGIMDAAFTALSGVVVEMRNVEEEVVAARATREGALKEAKAAVERCEEACETKFAAREEELSRKVSRVDTEQVLLEEREKDVTMRKAFLEVQEKALAAAEERMADELACFPDVKLGLRKALRSLCRDDFDVPLATPEDDFAVLVKEVVAALEAAITQMDMILDNECRDLIFTAATRVFSHLHLRDPGFDLISVIMPVPAEDRDRAAEAVKVPVDALVRRFARVAPPLSPGTAGADDGEDDASDVDDQPPAEGVTGGGSS